MDISVRPRGVQRSASRSRLTVLLVEDEPLLLDLMTAALEDAGFDVRAAASALDAMALLDTSPRPDLAKALAED